MSPSAQRIADLISVPLDRLLFGAHDMDWKHVDRHRGQWPAHIIDVEPLPGGYYFVHDGRHRATAAYEEGARWIFARVVSH